jgi:hypothetical protein
LRYAHSTNSERNIFGCHWWIRICSPFRSTWVHPWFSVWFAFLNLQFFVLWFVRHFQYLFFHFRLTIVLTICLFFELRLLILKLFFAAKLRFPLTWSFTTKIICRTTIRDNIYVISRSKTTACTWYVIKDCHVSFDIWKW